MQRCGMVMRMSLLLAVWNKRYVLDLKTVPGMSDGFDHDEAHNLAEKIIEYERNILYSNDIFKDELIVPNDADDMRGAAIRQKKETSIRRPRALANFSRVESRISVA